MTNFHDFDWAMAFGLLGLFYTFLKIYLPLAILRKLVIRN